MENFGGATANCGWLGTQPPRRRGLVAQGPCCRGLRGAQPLVMQKKSKPFDSTFEALRVELGEPRGECRLCGGKGAGACGGAAAVGGGSGRVWHQWELDKVVVEGMI